MKKVNSKFGIGRRIAVLVSTAVLITVICVAGVLAVFQAKHNTLLKRSSIEGTAYVFASAVAEHVEANRSHEIRTVLRSVDRVPGVISASVYNAEGKLLGALGQRAVLTVDNISNDPGFWDMMRSGTIPVTVGIVKNARPVGTLVLVTDISDLRSTLFNTIAVVLLVSLLAALVGVMFSLPLQRRITGPIVRLTESMRALRENRDYQTDLLGGGNDETGVMVETFNNLIADIRFRDDSLQKLAYYDPLTGLPNRTNFQRTLQERLKKLGGANDSLAVILFNIDSFHSFNDAFGHSIGDAVLMNVAAIIKEQAGPDAVTARVGGDEFAVILSDDGSNQQAESTIAQVQSAFYKPLLILDFELHLTVSAGASILPRDSETVGDAMRHIDLARNAAKKMGPGRAVFFSSDLDEVVKRETDLGQGLRSAIVDGELEVHYQPQYHIQSQKIVGFEALLRWKHPELGYVSPAIFVPIAEKSGSITAIGDWVMNESCRQAKAWLDAGHTPRSIAVNVSPAQMLQSGFVRKVDACLERHGLPHELLCIELTESLFLGRSLTSVRSILDDLHSLGVTLALDDFGTGYSSLAYLSQLPFDKLKIDRSFVTSANTSPRRRQILQSIITMAHSLGMEVVAEGAETTGEMDLLGELAADQIQGYGIARPEVAEKAMANADRIEREKADSRKSVATAVG